MALIRSTLPAAYMSLWFSDPAAVAGSHRSGRSPKRTFTARRLDPEARTMTVDFVLHGTGPASTWAEDPEVGTVIWSGETRAGYRVPPKGSHLVLVGDETAIPAMGAIVEATEHETRITAVVEVVDGLDERPLTRARDVDPIWVHRGHDPSSTGALVLNLLASLTVPDDAYWWVAGERAAVLSMRDLLETECGVSRGRMTLNAHWRLTDTDPRRRQGRS